MWGTDVLGARCPHIQSAVATRFIQASRLIHGPQDEAMQVLEFPLANRRLLSRQLFDVSQSIAVTHHLAVAHHLQVFD